MPHLISMVALHNGYFSDVFHSRPSSDLKSLMVIDMTDFHPYNISQTGAIANTFNSSSMFPLLSSPLVQIHILITQFHS